MTLNNERLLSFSRAEFNTYNLEGLDISTSLAIEYLSKEIQEDFEDLNSLETKEARFNYFKIEGTTTDSYKEHIYNIDKKKSFIYGIRHFNGNKDFPFVQLRSNFSIETSKQALECYQLIEEELSSFAPRYISFHTAMPIKCELVCSTYMVAKMETIEDTTAWKEERNLTFKNIDNNDYYEWFSKGYEEFHLENSHLKEKVSLNSMETMQESIEQNLLKSVFYKGELIGLIAAIRSDFLGMPGIYFNEIFISKTWKGKGLAKAIQRKFLTSFSEDAKFVWGTIDADNLPSFKTAFSNGRRPIRFENFVGL
ncbi:hypothetical protein [Halobacteriovorax sp. HLS]|uniref:hypothetical protein n=1 Tax=Halobacteriovorax sp. HLS TaxID=2234000 RepID=UPI000FD96D9F|nr:hypothetical protein [Halobacteriovorax sp. HLS]